MNLKCCNYALFSLLLFSSVGLAQTLGLGAYTDVKQKKAAFLTIYSRSQSLKIKKYWMNERLLSKANQQKSYKDMLKIQY